jgi:hypothetical protein
VDRGCLSGGLNAGFYSASEHARRSGPPPGRGGGSDCQPEAQCHWHSVLASVPVVTRGLRLGLGPWPRPRAGTVASAASDTGDSDLPAKGRRGCQSPWRCARARADDAMLPLPVASCSDVGRSQAAPPGPARAAPGPRPGHWHWHAAPAVDLTGTAVTRRTLRLPVTHGRGG